jgi:NADH-quinone oxidoreductase subunit C
MSAEASAPDLRAALRDRYGERVRLSESFGGLTAEVAPELWPDLAAFARDRLGMTFFDWLTGVDEPPDRIAVVAHVYDIAGRRRLLLRTAVDRGAPRLATLTGVYRGADWHERETYEMFGVVFDGHPDLRPLLLPDGFEGYPLRKDFVLAARVAKPWPGAKEPGESGRATARRRRPLPPGVPPDWGTPEG